MRILFLGDNREDEDIYRNFLGSIAEKDSIYFVYSCSEVVDFINNKTVRLQQELDLIILNCQKDPLIEQDFGSFINKDQERTYSNRNFNLTRIPILLIIDKTKDKAFYTKYGFSNVLLDPGVDNFHKYQKETIHAIKTWRKKVVDEMDNLGIKFNSGYIDYSYYFESKVNSRMDTEILSESFKSFPRKLNYYWLEINKQQIENAIDEYITLLKRTHRKNKKQEELLYHSFFNENLHFLERDNFSNTWHEPKLELPNNRGYNPDYTLKPNFNYQTDLSLIEVKLPNEGFLKGKNFHPTLLARIIGHLTQVNDYKEYLEDRDYREFINKKFGFVPNRIDYGILVGRSVDR